MPPVGGISRRPDINISIERANQTTNFSDSDSFSNKFINYDYGGFKIEPIDPKSCYGAKAVSKNETYTWFEIEMDEDTGVVTKTCGDSSKTGCEEGNKW